MIGPTADVDRCPRRPDDLVGRAGATAGYDAGVIEESPAVLVVYATGIGLVLMALYFLFRPKRRPVSADDRGVRVCA